MAMLPHPVRRSVMLATLLLLTTALTAMAQRPDNPSPFTAREYYHVDARWILTGEYDPASHRAMEAVGHSSGCRVWSAGGSTLGRGCSEQREDVRFGASVTSVTRRGRRTCPERVPILLSVR